MKKFVKLTMALAMSISLIACGSSNSTEEKEEKQEETTTKAEVINLYGSKKLKLGELEYGINPDFTLGFDENDDSLAVHTFYLNGEDNFPMLMIANSGKVSDEVYANFDTDYETDAKAVANNLNLGDYSYDIQYKKLNKEKAFELDYTLSSDEIEKVLNTDVDVEGDIELIVEGILCPNKQNFMIAFFKESADENKYDLDDFIKSIDFSKFESESSSDDSKQDESNQNTQSDDSTVDPDLKAFLDSYEAFMDQYVEFMEQYKANPTDMTLLSEYADFMSQYADFAEKAEQYSNNEDEMSAADLAYYLEVTARIEQKLLSVQ